MNTPSADNAISILMSLLDSLPASQLVYLVAPNVILSLAGARGYCDGVYYSQDHQILNDWVGEMHDVIKKLYSVTDIFFSDARLDTTPNGDEYAGFDLILTNGLRYTLEKTSLIHEPIASFLKEHSDSNHLIDELAKSLANDESFKQIAEEKQRDGAVGILLGYPDKAIEGAVNLWQRDNPFAEGFIEADIRGASYYVCPQPVYEYPRHLVNDPDIVAHENLWSSILTDYYHSDFHKKLEQDPHFQLKAQALDLLP